MNAPVCYFAAAVFALSGAWFSYSAAHDPRDGAGRAAQLRAEVEERLVRNQQMELEIEEMRALALAVKTDPSRLEEVARRRLQMIKRGEVFVLPAN